MITTVISIDQFLHIQKKHFHQNVYYCTDCIFKNVILFGNVELIKANRIYRNGNNIEKKKL